MTEQSLQNYRRYKMNIKGIDRAKVLMALYNGSKQQGMGVFNTRGSMGMNVEDARKELDNNPDGYFDYLHGRILKIKITEDCDDLDIRLYDRDNGQGCGSSLISEIQ